MHIMHVDSATTGNIYDNVNDHKNVKPDEQEYVTLPDRELVNDNSIQHLVHIKGPSDSRATLNLKIESNASLLYQEKTKKNDESLRESQITDISGQRRALPMVLNENERRGGSEMALASKTLHTISSKGLSDIPS